MQKYEDNLAANSSGALRPLSGASIVVTDMVTGLSASLYLDNGATPLAQPLISDNDGYFGFYAADGKYLLTFTGPRFAEFVREIVLEDPLDDPYATVAQLAAPSGASLVRHGENSVGDVLDQVLQELEDLDSGLSYVLPKATAAVLGGIRLGSNLSADADGVVTAGVANGAIVSKLLSAATAVRTHTFPDKDGTVAMTSDIVGGAMFLLGSADITAAVASVNFLNVYGSGYSSYLIKLYEFAPASAAAALVFAHAVTGAEVATASFQISTTVAPAFGAVATIEIDNTVGNWKVAHVKGAIKTAAGSLTNLNSYWPVDIAGVLTGFTLTFTSRQVGAGKVRVYGIKN